MYNSITNYCETSDKDLTFSVKDTIEFTSIQRTLFVVPNAYLQYICNL